MIKSFRHKGLAELFEEGHAAQVSPDLQKRILRILEALDQAENLAELNIPGFNIKGLYGGPGRYSIHVNGSWCAAFEWQRGHALGVDLEQCH